MQLIEQAGSDLEVVIKLPDRMSCLKHESFYRLRLMRVMLGKQRDPEKMQTRSVLLDLKHVCSCFQVVPFRRKPLCLPPSSSSTTILNRLSLESESYIL